MRVKAERNDSGFSLVESLLCIVILGLMAGSVGALYMSGIQALDAQGVRIQLDSLARSRMEWLLSEDFGQLASGSEVVGVNGKDYMVTWTVEGMDLDGDSVPEPAAKRIDVCVEGNTLSAIVVDHGGEVCRL